VVKVSSAGDQLCGLAPGSAHQDAVVASRWQRVVNVYFIIS